MVKKITALLAAILMGIPTVMTKAQDYQKESGGLSTLYRGRTLNPYTFKFKTQTLLTVGHII